MALKTAGVYEVDPISRIEGHLGVKLTVGDDGYVDRADVHGNLWRGFENFLIGREPNDPITFTQRICGVCPIPHGQAATFAADNVYGYNTGMQTWVTADEGGMWGGETGSATPEPTPATYGIPEKAVLIRNVVLSAEFLMSHITHLYHLAAPSYVQGPAIPPWTPYFDDSYYNALLLSNGRKLPESSGGFSSNLWSAVIKQYVKALRIRRLTFEAGALFAGRMPMTSCFVAGGVTNDHEADLALRCGKYHTLMVEVGNFIVKEFVPLFLALGYLYKPFDNKFNNSKQASDPDVGTDYGFGAGCGNFLSWGAFPQKDGTLGFKRGFKIGSGDVGTITRADVEAKLSEHIKHSRYEGSVTALNADGSPNVATAVTRTNPKDEWRTIPKRDALPAAEKYSWLKAPRWDSTDTPMEVGPLARMVVSELYPLGSTFYLASGGNALQQLYRTYTKSVNGTAGLDPAMVEADLAVALVRTGVATLRFWNGTAWVDNDLSKYGDANAVITGPIVTWLVTMQGGLSTMDRLRGRALEALVLIIKMIGAPTKGTSDITWPTVDAVDGSGVGVAWIQQLKLATGATYISKGVPSTRVQGIGATEAPRGALMHMSTVENGRIIKYQCIVPTTWNACPKDTEGVSGPMEQAMLGIPYDAAGAEYTPVGSTTPVVTGGGVEALRVAQSFDPCIACAVH